MATKRRKEAQKEPQAEVDLFVGWEAEAEGIFGAGEGETLARGATVKGRRAGTPAAAFAVLSVAEFALQAVLRLERGLEERAVALFGDKRVVAEATLMESSARVLAGTAAARAAGVAPGQTVPQALARCAELVLRTARPAAEAEARAGLLAAALTVSPQIEDTAAGVCTIDVTALAAEKRPAALRDAVEQLEKLGLRASAGLAASPWLALLAARWGAGEEERGVRAEEEGGRDGELGGAGRGRTADESSGAAGFGDPALHDEDARRAGTRGAAGGGDIVRWDGRRAVAWWCGGSGRAAELRGDFLRGLPVAVAEPSAEVAEILAGWGVRTLGDVTALPKAELARRLGAAGARLWDRAAGEGTRPLRVWAPAPVFFAELTLEDEVETLEPLLFLLRRFVDRLALELRAAGFVAGELTLGLKLSDETGYERAFRLPEPTAREEILFRVLHTHLESLQTAATVCGVSLRCAPVRPLVRQQGIFESALRDPHGFAETLARVAAVVGADRVGTPVLENTHRADAVRLVTPADVVPAAGERAAVHARRGLALRRWRPAAAATVELAAGGRPAFVWAEGVRGDVCACAGPWRSSGDWWEEARAWRREEWDVELAGGGLYRLRHAPEGWFVEGEYD